MAENIGRGGYSVLLSGLTIDDRKITVLPNTCHVERLSIFQ